MAHVPSVFSDAVLEVLSRVGDGPGGPTDEVKDKRTTIMARKTIVIKSGEGPMKQLLRELNVVQSSAHPNIITFYGVFMLPSPPEVRVNLLLEFCPGRSLEAIERRLADRNERVGEKVAGRLAEGVSSYIYYC